MCETVSKDMQIFVLDQHAKDELKDKLQSELSRDIYDLGHYEIDWVVEDALDSRLCDLEEVININNLETIKIKGEGKHE